MTATLPQGSVPNLRYFGEVQIANGASLSDALNLAGHTLVGIVMPAAWTAADLTFQASHDGTTYNNVYDDDDIERTVQADASRFIALSPIDWLGMPYLKVRSGPAAAAVNQGALRTIILVVVP